MFYFPCRPRERCSPSCLLGTWPGHPVMPQLPTWVHCQVVQAPLPRLWPRSVWRMLPGASASPIARLGPSCARVRRLQPETWRALTWGALLPQSTREDRSLSLQSGNCWSIPPLLQWCCLVSVERKSVEMHRIFNRFGLSEFLWPLWISQSVGLLDWVWKLHFNSDYSQAQYFDLYWHKNLSFPLNKAFELFFYYSKM